MTWEEKQIELLKMGFVVRDCQFGGDDCVLIYPSKKATFNINWTPELLKFRSSLWLKKIPALVSGSFPKFFNWGERPDLCEPPESLVNAIAVEKIDGSCLLVSKWCGELIVRTRGTTDARTLDNGSEIDQLIEKYPIAFDNQLINSEAHTLIFEWVTPTNRIVIDYGDEPRLFLTGIVKHQEYTISTQGKLDAIATFLDVERPKTYDFNSVDEMREAVLAFQGKEGVCVYFGKDQQKILKLKGDEYLTLHAFKSHCSIKSIIDLFIAAGLPSHDEFVNKIASEFDWECVQLARGLVSKVCDANEEVNKMLAHMEKFVAPLRDFRVKRKDAARKIYEAYGSTHKTKYAFHLLDEKPIDIKMRKKLLEQICRK